MSTSENPRNASQEELQILLSGQNLGDEARCHLSNTRTSIFSECTVTKINFQKVTSSKTLPMINRIRRSSGVLKPYKNCTHGLSNKCKLKKCVQKSSSGSGCITIDTTVCKIAQMKCKDTETAHKDNNKKSIKELLELVCRPMCNAYSVKKHEKNNESCSVLGECEANIISSPDVKKKNLRNMLDSICSNTDSYSQESNNSDILNLKQQSHQSNAPTKSNSFTKNFLNRLPHSWSSNSSTNTEHLLPFLTPLEGESQIYWTSNTDKTSCEDEIQLSNNNETKTKRLCSKDRFLPIFSTEIGTSDLNNSISKDVIWKPSSFQEGKGDTHLGIREENFPLAVDSQFIHPVLKDFFIENESESNDTCFQHTGYKTSLMCDKFGCDGTLPILLDNKCIHFSNLGDDSLKNIDNLLSHPEEQDHTQIAQSPILRSYRKRLRYCEYDNEINTFVSVAKTSSQSEQQESEMKPNRDSCESERTQQSPILNDRKTRHLKLIAKRFVLGPEFAESKKKCSTTDDLCPSGFNPPFTTLMENNLPKLNLEESLEPLNNQKCLEVEVVPEIVDFCIQDANNSGKLNGKTLLNNQETSENNYQNSCYVTDEVTNSHLLTSNVFDMYNENPPLRECFQNEDNLQNLTTNGEELPNYKNNVTVNSSVAHCIRLSQTILNDCFDLNPSWSNEVMDANNMVDASQPNCNTGWVSAHAPTFTNLDYNTGLWTYQTEPHSSLIFQSPTFNNQTYPLNDEGDTNGYNIFSQESTVDNDSILTESNKNSANSIQNLQLISQEQPFMNLCKQAIARNKDTANTNSNIVWSSQEGQLELGNVLPITTLESDCQTHVTNSEKLSCNIYKLGTIHWLKCALTFNINQFKSSSLISSLDEFGDIEDTRSVLRTAVWRYKSDGMMVYAFKQYEKQQHDCQNTGSSISPISISSSYDPDAITAYNSLSQSDYALRGSIDRVCQDKLLLYDEQIDKDVPFVSQKQTIATIERLIERMNAAFENNKFPFLNVKRRLKPSDCVFVNDRWMLLHFKCISTSCVRITKANCKRQGLNWYLLGKLFLLLQTDMKVTKREMYYEVKHLVQSISTIYNAVLSISYMLNVGEWRFNIASRRGLVYGNLQLKMSSNEILSCNVYDAEIPYNLEDITEIRSSARFILVLEKEAIFRKLVAEDLPNKLPLPFIMITGKGFPDYNTRLFVNKLWRVMLIPVFLLMDADPHGIGIMMLYRFGCPTTAHLSHELAVPNARWLGIFPSEIGKLNISSLPLAKREKSLARNYIKSLPMKSHPRIKEELNILLIKDKKAAIEGVTDVSNFLSDTYLPMKFIKGDFV